MKKILVFSLIILFACSSNLPHPETILVDFKNNIENNFDNYEDHSFEGYYSNTDSISAIAVVEVKTKTKIFDVLLKYKLVDDEWKYETWLYEDSLFIK
jgi:hypothetical protein